MLRARAAVEIVLHWRGNLLDIVVENSGTVACQTLDYEQHLAVIIPRNLSD